MPRLHLGSNRPSRAGSSSARAAASRRSLSPASSSSLSPAHLPATAPTTQSAAAAGAMVDALVDNDNGSSEFDEFDYEDFDFDGWNEFKNGGKNKKEDGPASGKTQTRIIDLSFAAQQKQKTSKQQSDEMIYDSSDSFSSSSLLSEEEFFSSKKKKSSLMKKPNNARKHAPPTRKIKPTVSSPKITITDLSKPSNNRNNKRNTKPVVAAATAGKRQVKKKGPLGKPIKKATKSKIQGNDAKSKSDDENVENFRQVEKGDGASKSGNKRKNSKGATKNLASFSSSASEDKNKEAMNNNLVTAVRKKSKSKGNKSITFDCLFDTDDEESKGEEDEDDDEVMMSVRKSRAQNKKKLEKKSGPDNVVPKATKARTTKPQAVASTDSHDINDSLSRQKQHPHQETQVQVLPLRALAIDNRAVPTLAGDGTARNSFLNYFYGLLEGGLDKGVLSSSTVSGTSVGPGDTGAGDSGTIIASLTKGPKCHEKDVTATKYRAKKSTGGRNIGSFGNGRCSGLVQNAIVPQVAYLFAEEEQEQPNSMAIRKERASWLSEFLSPLNNGLDGGDLNAADNIDMDRLESTNNRFDYGTNNEVDAESHGFDNAAVNDSSANEQRKGFAARDSWSYFGDLVKAIEHKLSSSSSDKSSAQAVRPITLFTTDANFFCDAKSASHLCGLDEFWKRIHSHAESGTTNIDNGDTATTTSSITIMIVETTSVLQAMRTIGSNNYDDNNDSYNNNNSNNSFMGNSDYYGTSNNEKNSDSFDSASIIPNCLRVIQCVNDLRRRIRELTQQQSEAAPHRDDSASIVDLRLEFMEGNDISFQSLLQSWTKESFTQTYSRCNLGDRGGVGVGVGGGGVGGSLSFDLPETLDGIMCSITLDLQYSTLPQRINSLATRGLVEDMRAISLLEPSRVEVVHTIPLSSIDSALIYGVPMCARAAMENDISRYDEMKMLTRQLWRYLGRDDAGLVLRVRPVPDEGSNDSRRNMNSSSLGYHSSSAEQLFLLVCEEAVQKQPPVQSLLDHDNSNVLFDPSDALQVAPNKKRKGEAPCQGMLYRYATKSQMLRFGNEEMTLDEAEEDGSSQEMSDHYLDYIERSLDTLVKTGLNPLLTGNHECIGN